LTRREGDLPVNAHSAVAMNKDAFILVWSGVRLGQEATGTCRKGTTSCGSLEVVELLYVVDRMQESIYQGKTPAEECEIYRAWQLEILLRDND